MLGFDGVMATFQADMGTDNGTTEALKITLNIDGLNDVHADILDDLWCENTLSEGQYDATKCFLDEDTS